MNENDNNTKGKTMNAIAITPEIESEAAIWAEGTQYTQADIIKAFREHLETASDLLDIQRFCEQVLKINA